MVKIGGALFGNPAQLVDPRILAGTDGREAPSRCGHDKPSILWSYWYLEVGWFVDFYWFLFIPEVSILLVRSLRFSVFCLFFVVFFGGFNWSQWTQARCNLWQVIRVQSGGKARDGLMHTATVNIHGPRQHSLPCTHDSWKTCCESSTLFYVSQVRVHFDVMLKDTSAFNYAFS